MKKQWSDIIKVMKSKSAKAKGGRFENYLVERFREIDPKAHRNYGSGAGLDKQDVRIPSLNIEIEAKNQQTIKLLDWWEQTEKQRTLGNTGILAIRNPKKPEFAQTLIVLDLEDFMEILQGDREPIETTSEDRKAKWETENAIRSLKSLLKVLE